MSPSDILAVALACAPNVAPSTLQGIVDIESRGNPYAIGINGDTQLERQPASEAEAIAWARWLRAHGYNFDAGLGQINSTNWDRLGITAETVFQPCTNLRAAGQVLSENYQSALTANAPGSDALLAAVSAYNTGNFHRGFRNGYVRNFVAAVSHRTVGEQLVADAGAPPLKSRTRAVAASHAPSQHLATTEQSGATDWQAADWQSPSEWGSTNLSTVSADTSPRKP